MKTNHALLATLKPGQMLQTKEIDPILAAVADHAKKFEEAAAASALEVKALGAKNAELQDSLNGVLIEVAALKSNPGALGGNDPVPSPVADFVKSSASLQAMRDGSNSTGRVELKAAGLKLLAKSISNTGLGQVGDQQYSVQPNRDAVHLWANPQRPLRLLDLLPSIQVSTATFEYMQLSAAAPIAGVQALEFDEKQQAAIATAVQTSSIATIAHWVRASQQVLQDAGALQLQLNNLLEYGCLNRLENQLVNGPGGVGQIKGLLPSATAFAATSTEAQDRIGEAVTALQSVGFVPSVIVMNPIDWGKIQRLRTTQDGYVLGSPVAPISPSLWSVSVVTSASLAAGTALVMDASQVCLLDRQQVTVQLSNEDANNFTTNACTIRAELRSGLAVFSPAAVLSLSLAAA